MRKLITIAAAVMFAASTLGTGAFAQDQKKEQVHKGTPEAGTVQKKDQKKAKKKNATGKTKKEATSK